MVEYVKDIKDLHAACGIILNPKDYVLLQKKDVEYPWDPGQWTLFGGMVEEGETPRQTFEREIEHEETGIKLEDIVHFIDQPFSDDLPEHKWRRQGVLHVYAARFDGKLDKIKLGEGAGFAVYAKEEIPALNMPEHNKAPLLQFYAELDKYETLDAFFKALHQRKAKN